LNDCRVPVFVLNACKSGQAGEEAFSSVAGQLVKLGAKGVVAMAYSVYATGAKHFMRRLYGELVRGQDIASAVAAGRKSMSIDKQRPSPKGLLPLQDWLVPVLYQQEPYQPFTPSTVPTSREERRKPRQPAKCRLSNLPQEGSYGFIGRDYDILLLERAFRQNNIVLLQGMGGVGKTELVNGFARWLADTQGRAGGVFFTSFEQGAPLSNVVNQVGREVWGDDFSKDLLEDQREDVLEYLQTHPCLLIWDNFEPMNGFPQGNQPLLPAAERDSLKQFLKELRGGQSWVLITSRREENWLDCGYALRELKGLVKPDAEELAARILQEAGVDRAKLPGEYLELLKLLGGHPLSLRVVLRHLKTQSPVQLIEALRRGLDTFNGAQEEGREKSLTVSLDYSFANLSERARQHLPFLGLFCDRVDAHWLHSFSLNPDSDWGQAYRAVFGENLQKSDWIGLLNEATAAGILEDLGGSIYKIHPALPWYLRQQLDTKGSQEVINNLEKKLLFFYAHLANKYDRELIGNAELATFVLRVEEPNLLQLLRIAEQQQDWNNAYRILGALGKVYERWGRQPEFKSLRERALNQIGIHLPQAKAKGQDAFDFWMYLRGVDANEALDSADLETARAVYQEIIDELTALNNPSVNDKIAALNHQLGILALKQRQFDDAIAFHNQAVQIYEDAGDFYSAARDYHHLGIVAQEQRQFDDAIAFHQKSLQIFEDAGDSYNAASDYHELGIVAYQQRRFDDAIAFYHKSLQIKEDVGNFYKAASDYHNLGMVAQKQRRFDDAIAFYNKALQIYEDAGNFYNAASDYHQLGMVAQEQRRFDDAIAFYQKALQIFEDAGDFYSAATDYHVLGLVAQEQRRFDDAINFYEKSLQIFEDAEDFYGSAKNYTALGQVAIKQGRLEEASAVYRKAVQVCEDADDFYRAAFYYHLLGLVAQEQRQFDDSIAFYQKAVQINEDADDLCQASYQYQGLGEIAKEQGDFETAVACFQTAFEARSAANDWHQASSTLNAWGKTLEARSNWTEATQIYLHALAIDIEHNEEWVGSDITDLGRMLKQLGDSQFKIIWREFMGNECPEDWFSAIQEASSIDPN
jgi:tetratricopeptide (TPR) repeat protein